jgi:hypothetical protein
MAAAVAPSTVTAGSAAAAARPAGGQDLLDESSFAASPGHVIPDKLGEAVSGVAGGLRNRADGDHPA